MIIFVIAYKPNNFQVVSKETPTKTLPASSFSSAKDATYLIDNQLVTLVSGLSEINTPDSSSKKITRYFGNEAFGDLNGDDKLDIALLLTQENDGSGTFYYVAVALASDKGFQGTNAIFLGDRIAPQTTEINERKIIVNYADRKPSEPMIVSPSLGVSKYFQIKDGALIEVKQ